MTFRLWMPRRIRRRTVGPALAGAFLALLALGPGLAAGCAEAADTLSFERIAEDLDRPVGITNAGDGSGRLFIVLQRGQVVVHDGRGLRREPFLDIAGLVSCCGEQGLLDIAFHPDHAENGLFFVSYTDRSGDSVIARYRVSADRGRADPDSAEVLLTVEQPYGNHNGGQIRFGPDGFLYAGYGDGGAAGDPGDRAQDKGELLGKMLRLDVDGGVNGGPGYAVPPDNPFVGDAKARPEIWALGLRNPWRFSFDRRTGDLFIGDVGQSSIEEIDLQRAGSPGGENYGWRLMEGRACYTPAAGCNDGTLVPPILQVDHAGGDCSITGGYRYRGTATPEAEGVYLFGDYCTGQIRAAVEDADGRWHATDLIDTDYRISSFGEDEAGELYLADHGRGDGAVYRLVLQKALGGL